MGLVDHDGDAALGNGVLESGRHQNGASSGGAQFLNVAGLGRKGQFTRPGQFEFGDPGNCELGIPKARRQV